MSAKKTILILCDWFLPGYMAGGPIQSIATLTKQLENDVHFKIITTDRDFRADKAYDNVAINKWTTFEGREVFYVSPENMNPGFILDLIKNTTHDSLYLNSLFSKLFTLYPLRWKKQGNITSGIVLAPRGMCGDGAMAIKPFKKKVFLKCAKLFGLFTDIYWQSTSGQETAEIKKCIGNSAKVYEVSNLPNIACRIAPIEKKRDEIKLCFISRISEKKNLNFAIDVLKAVKTTSVLFDVYGPVEDEAYWNICLANARQLPGNVTFNYKGVLKPSEIGPTIGKYHALLLPTKNENYGHIIVETLQHGRPVVLSDQTPWRDLCVEQVGFDIPLAHKTDFVNAIESIANQEQEEFDMKSKKCLHYIEQKLHLPQIRLGYIHLFNL